MKMKTNFKIVQSKILYICICFNEQRKALLTLLTEKQSPTATIYLRTVRGWERHNTQQGLGL